MPPMRSAAVHIAFPAPTLVLPASLERVSRPRLRSCQPTRQPASKALAEIAGVE